MQAIGEESVENAKESKSSQTLDKLSVKIKKLKAKSQ